MARTESEMPPVEDEATEAYASQYPLQASLDKFNRLSQAGKYDHTWETKSIVLPYVTRNHAWNFDEHDQTNWEDYKEATPAGYQETVDYEDPHPTVDNYPKSAEPEDEFVKCQDNAVNAFKHAKTPDEKRFTMK